MPRLTISTTGKFRFEGRLYECTRFDGGSVRVDPIGPNGRIRVTKLGVSVECDPVPEPTPGHSDREAR